MPSTITSLVARVDSSGRLARCAACDELIAPLAWRGGRLHPLFSAEWREREDHVWRLTDYARFQRRRSSGAPLTRPRAKWRPPWSEPARWKPVIAALPCRVECGACGVVQSVGERQGMGATAPRFVKGSGGGMTQ